MSSGFKGYLNQKHRLFIILIYLLSFFAISFQITHEYIPFDANQRLWLISAIGYCLFTLLSAPWFRPPRDSLTNAFTAGLLLFLLDFTNVEFIQYPLSLFRWLAFGFLVFIVISSIIAIMLHDSNDDDSNRSKIAYRLSNSLGKGEVVFSFPVIIGIFGFYQSSLQDIFILTAFWVTVILIKPIENLFLLFLSISFVKNDRLQNLKIGEIARIDHPNIIRVQLDENCKWDNNKTLVASLHDETNRIVIPINHYFQDSAIIGTGLITNRKVEDDTYSKGSIYTIDTEQDCGTILKEEFKNDNILLIGFIVEDTSISTIKFELIEDINLEEGTLVCCYQNDLEIYYQVLDAKTEEESISSNPSGKHIVTASQLGRIDENGTFLKHGWLPLMNSPVFAPEHSISSPTYTPKKEEFIVGNVPGSNIPVYVNFNDLLEYHSAILGVTGTGKTELAFDIIEKALSQNTKVFCVDFTNEYAIRLREHNPQRLGLSEEEAKKFNDKLFAVDTGKFGAPDEKKALQSFVSEIDAPIKKSVEEFLQPTGSSLGIFELPEITNTKATLRATELYLSNIMEWARVNRKARRVLVVLEEAHTIIPETVGSGFDFDTQWVVSRISQIALQGRKYGVGLLIISQRTALVSKSILSQCNTHFTFSLIDKTSLDYLANVHSPAHVRLIPNLGFLDAIVYGKAVKSERPIRIKLPYDPKKKKASESLNVKLEDDTEEPQISEYSEGDELESQE